MEKITCKECISWSAGKCILTGHFCVEPIEISGDELACDSFLEVE